MNVGRDRWGVPHVRGVTVLDLAHRQGRVTAHDRAWQLTVERLRGEARTGVLGGSDAWDALARDLDIEGTARRGFAALDPESQELFAAYAEGVRAGFAEGATSPELADRAAPGEWQEWTPVAVFLVQHVLFAGFPTKLWAASVGPGLDPRLAELLGVEPPHGSNAFAVGGARTASGAPLIGADPHRVFEAPGIYQQVRLSCDELDVVGLAFPGVPGVQHFGHTGHVAWAVTNAMADYQDVSVEDGRLVVRTPTTVLGDVGLAALLPLLRARTVADVDAALDRWVEPVNNVLVADTAGRVLHRVAGRVPVRSDSEWTGWAELPRTEVAPDAVAVTANDRTDERWDVLADRFAPSWRRDRIASLLSRADQTGAVDVATATRVLTDEDGTSGGSLLALLLALPGLPGPSRALVERLRLWDRSMAADSYEAGAFGAVRDAVVAAVAAHPLLDPARAAAPPVHSEVLAPWWHLPSRVARVLPDLVADPPAGLDLVAIARAALAQAAAAPAQAWGERHRFAPQHAFADLALDPSPHLPSVAGSPLGGDTESVVATAWIPGTDAVVTGPIARVVWDLADRSRSRWAVPLGASGVAGDSHHDDQFTPWKDGTLLPVSPPEHSPPAFTLRPVDPPADAVLLHGWFTQPRATFWGMGTRTVEEVGEIYGWIAEQDHLTASLVLLDDRPLGLLQTYDPFVDEIGEHYDRRSGDIGLHLFLADDSARAGRTSRLMEFLLEHLFSDPAVQRIVLEPDVANEKSIALLQRHGAELGPVTEIPAPVPDLPPKTAQLAFIHRPA
ncbi:GNAT family N-acetyltransferase [Nocardioides eburneiflavus]|uniref:Lysine N-acyltransferase MbtK n=1 Tax=Nocardioides eburneiflavus TaxID=2518372 RepID=A0A4Z1C396_9ACTN|nr:GNAT family N-acetyltransferase [Nocardioides eburneiflavus]TGN63462.1 GNAT family N-acetyltransferase [Nocardioides eburneiflavus]